MDRKEVNTFLKKIDETNSLDLIDEIEIRFYKVYKGLLFNEIFPPWREFSGLFKLTSKGKSLIE